MVYCMPLPLYSEHLHTPTHNASANDALIAKSIHFIRSLSLLDITSKLFVYSAQHVGPTSSCGWISCDVSVFYIQTYK